MELVALNAAIEQVQSEYAFSHRRACGLVTMAVATYRYRSLRTDEPLGTKLVELARERSRASGIDGCRCYCDEAENR